MAPISSDQVLDLLRSGTEDERVAFVQNLPPSSFKDASLALVGSDNPAMVVLGMSPLIQEYCFGGDPAVGAPLAAAAHERAVEISETIPDHGLLPTMLSGLASNHLKALSLLGRSQEIVDTGARYVDFYQQLGENENLPSMRVLRIEALVNLRRIDETDEELEDEELLQQPIMGMEARRLKGWVDMYRRDPTALKSEGPSAPEAPSTESLLGLMKTAIGIGFEGEVGQRLEKLVDGLDATQRVDTDDPEQYRQLLDVLDQGEQFLTRGGEDSELVVRGKIRNATAMFVHEEPSEERIRGSLVELQASLAWAREHALNELINDALWGIYLCNSRLKQPSEAADALIGLRDNLESMRAGIKDPMKRGGIFGTYQYLFNAMCEQLHKAGRYEDLLEAIESSKGRVIADRLTQQGDEVVADAAIYRCVQDLPELAKREGFHYLTYFVDEECVYAVLVSKQGEVHGIEPVPIENAALRQASLVVKPGKWGQPKSFDPGSKYPDVSELLRPLVAFLDDLLAAGVVADGDHICYSPDDDFHNVPLHFLHLGDGIVLDRFSVSRVHSAFHLDRVLDNDADGSSNRYVGFVVPARQDLEGEAGEQMLANLEAPIQWLESHGIAGETISLEDATPERVKEEELARAIIHFSVHGWFPEDGNPFLDSYLLLAGADGLPDKNRVAQGDHDGTLSPCDILEAALDLEGSHVSMMACLSGLAREGIAGDILGLDWALIQCGASSLISTHWQVSAACAARFFESFYQKWIGEGQSRASAWRQAMLELIDDDYSFDSLDKWSAFSLTGDFR